MRLFKKEDFPWCYNSYVYDVNSYCTCGYCLPLWTIIISSIISTTPQHVFIFFFVKPMLKRLPISKFKLWCVTIRAWPWNWRLRNFYMQFFQHNSKLLLILLHLITHPTKCYTNSKQRALSEKNPTRNKCVFKCFAKVAGPTVRSINSTGNSFQQLGPATAKALKPQSVLWLGTTRSPRTADLKADRPEIDKPLMQKATR